VGGPNDNPVSGLGIGAAWVYTRSNGVWTQQGSKLVGTGAVGNAEQGWSVSLSSDGNTPSATRQCCTCSGCSAPRPQDAGSTAAAGHVAQLPPDSQRDECRSPTP
jgi:hypothetical protein